MLHIANNDISYLLLHSQRKRITVEINLYSKEANMLNTIPVNISVSENSVMINGEETQKKDAFNTILSDISEDKWEWLENVKIADNPLSYYIKK